MSRFAAYVLLVALSFPLIAAAFPADPLTNLPACCRKHGKHGCSMSKPRESAGPALRGLSKCPLYQRTAAIPASQVLAGYAPPRFVIAMAASHRSTPAQVASLYRIAFSRSSQKRGPPSLSC